MSRRLVLFSLLMSLALICASSIMHLSNVGMGSPGWPEVYGQIGLSHSAMQAGKSDTAVAAITSATLVDRAHRIVANILELLIIAVLISAFRHRRSSRLRRPLALPALALLLSLILAFLGAWYGSPLRYPWIMMTNVIGGICLFSIFWWLTLELYSGAAGAAGADSEIRAKAVAGLLLLAATIVLGAWTDAYYAALACKTLPDCHGQWGSLAALWRGLFELGVLEVDSAGRVVTDQVIAAGVHMAHRIAAFITAAYLVWLGIVAYGKSERLRRIGLVLLGLLLIQIGLGVASVVAGMPISTVVLHNLFSALLVASLVALMHQDSHHQR